MSVMQILLALCLIHAEVWNFGWNWYDVIEKFGVYERFDVMESWKFRKKNFVTKQDLTWLYINFK